MNIKWNRLKPFPDPRKQQFLIAPFGPGVYELINSKTGEHAIVGESKTVAYRMTSLLPQPFGSGTRNKHEKSVYVFENLPFIKYRTIPTKTKQEAKRIENYLQSKYKYIFST